MARCTSVTIARMTDPTMAPWLRGINPGQVTPLITSSERVIRVQAGPGTGKTLGIRRRVLRLLHPDGLGLEPDRVLVCAFNRVIAKELTAEIRAELEPYGLGLPVIRTIHALCAEIADTDDRLLLPHEIEALIYDIRANFTTIEEEYGRNASRALREHEAGLATHTALYQAVRDWLADHAAGLVGDAPRNVERAIAAGEGPLTRYDHVIVDEFQDLTSTEAQVVVKLRSDRGSLVAVGDRKQSIYAFRGNDDKGLDALPALVTETVSDHPMDQCWRCRDEIVELANGVMALEGDPLLPVQGPGAELHVLHFATPEAEVARIAEEAVRVFRARPDDKHLVLVTRRKWGYDLKSKIRDCDPAIPVETVFAEDVLQTWPAREAFILLSILGDPTDAVALRDWVAYREDDEGKEFKAPRRNAAAYLALKGRIGTLTLAKVEELRDVPTSDFAGEGRANLVARLHRLLHLRDTIDLGRPIEEIVSDVFDPERWISYGGDGASLARADLHRLKVESLRLVEEDPNLGAVARKLRYRIATREPLGEELGEGNAIRIVTMWGAKGLTSHHVYLLGLADEALPGRHDRDETGLELSEHLHEQRRLLYVSLTRAKRSLVISRATKLRGGQVAALGLRQPARWNRYWSYLSPCRFLADLSPNALPTSAAGEDWAGIDWAGISTDGVAP